MTTIEQIEAEIERRKMEAIGFRNNEKREDWASFFNGEATALENLLSFLSTLESEKPVPAIEEPIDGVLYAAACGIKNAAGKSEKPSEGLEDGDFDREITLIWGKCAAEPNDQIACLHIESFIEIARHFAQWGAEHLKK